YYPPIPPVSGACPTPLQRSLTAQLEYQATPDSAMQLIGFLEQVQTQLDAELKALPLPEQKATQGPIDDLRKRVAALPHGDAPRPQPLPAATQPQPAIPRTLTIRQPLPNLQQPLPAIQQPLPTIPRIRLTGTLPPAGSAVRGPIEV